MSIPDALQIFGENRVKDATLTALSGAASLENIRDGKYATKWTSVGSNDTTNEYISAQLLDRAGATTLYPFDTIILLNTNVKAGYAAYYNGSAWGNITGGTISALATTDTMVSFSEVTGSYMKLWLQTTQAANAQKYLGELKVCKHILTMSTLSNFARTDELRAGNYYTRGGNLVRFRIFNKFCGSLTLQNISKTQRDALWTAYDAYDFFVFAFFKDYALSETYDMAITSPPTETFNRKTQLYEITLEVKQR